MKKTSQYQSISQKRGVWWETSFKLLNCNFVWFLYSEEVVKV